MSPEICVIHGAQFTFWVPATRKLGARSQKILRKRPNWSIPGPARHNFQNFFTGVPEEISTSPIKRHHSHGSRNSCDSLGSIHFLGPTAPNIGCPRPKNIKKKAKMAEPWAGQAQFSEFFRG